MAMSQSGKSYNDIFLISKIEPEDFGGLLAISDFGRVLDRGILQDLSTSRIDMLMAHQVRSVLVPGDVCENAHVCTNVPQVLQAGRHETDKNIREGNVML